MDSDHEMEDTEPTQAGGRPVRKNSVAASRAVDRGKVRPPATSKGRWQHPGSSMIASGSGSGAGSQASHSPPLSGPV